MTYVVILIMTAFDEILTFDIVYVGTDEEKAKSFVVLTGDVDKIIVETWENGRRVNSSVTIEG